MHSSTRLLAFLWPAVLGALLGCQGGQASPTDDSKKDPGEIQSGNALASDANDEGTRLTSAQSSQVVCSPGGGAELALSGEFVTTGSADSIELVATVDGTRTYSLDPIPPQGFTIRNDREKAAPYAAVLPLDAQLPPGSHTVVVCGIQSGAQGRTPKQTCAPALPFSVDCSSSPAQQVCLPSCTGQLTAKGQVKTQYGALSFALAPASTIAKHRKASGDTSRDGCMQTLEVALQRTGGGCHLSLLFGPANGRYGGITQVSFTADSRCPEIPAEARGTYVTALGHVAIAPVLSKKVPSPAQSFAFLDDVQLSFPASKLRLFRSGAAGELQLDLSGLQLVGTMCSQGEPLGECTDPSSCGPGNWDGGDGWCVPEGGCSPGFRLEDGACVPEGSCRKGTHRCGSQCLSDGSVDSCGSACAPCARPENGFATCTGAVCGIGCNPGFHQCGDRCLADSSPLSCGSACTACPIPANATATCSSGACGFQCLPGFHACGTQCVPDNSVNSCGSSCTPCAAPKDGKAVCEAGSCKQVCDPGFHACGNACVPDSSTAACGNSCTPCEATANGVPACVAGKCTSVCNPGHHLCGDKCVPDSSALACGASCTPCAAPANGVAICNQVACGVQCDPGYHACGNKCLPNNSPQSCGSACTPCSAPSGSVATCDSGVCGFNCSPGFKACGGSCSICPAANVAATTCEGTRCVISQCAPGFHKCGDQCVSDNSPLTCGSSCTPCSAPAGGAATCDRGVCGISCNPGYRACGGACAACPTANVSTTACEDSKCVVAACAPGFHKCGDKCVSDNSPATCGSSCSPCDAPENSLATCSQGICGTTCLPGYHKCADQCVSDSAPATCGNSCTPCGVPPADAFSVCTNKACEFACNPGFIKGSGKCEGALDVQSGGSFTCAITQAGGVKCWGNNSYGQLGNGTLQSSNVPVDVVGLSSGVVAITAGRTHACAILAAEQEVRCWGNNSSGQLGDGTTNNRSTPVRVLDEVCEAGPKDIQAGDNYTCIITQAGAVKCWGNNAQGQLGDGTNSSRMVPACAIGLCSGISEIIVAQHHTCARTSAGGVKCWGYNRYGQLGDGTTVDRYRPVDVQGVSGALDLGAGLGHTCAALEGGAVKCWGDNTYGQLGDGTTVSRPLAVDVKNLASLAVGITCGNEHTCIRTLTGELKCWGQNANGQLGDGTQKSRASPAEVSGTQAFMSKVSAGDQHTCGVTNLGGIKCWGQNASGQVGDASFTNRLLPVDVSGR